MLFQWGRRIQSLLSPSSQNTGQRKERFLLASGEEQGCRRASEKSVSRSQGSQDDWGLSLPRKDASE